MRGIVIFILAMLLAYPCYAKDKQKTSADILKEMSVLIGATQTERAKSLQIELAKSQ